MNWDDLRILVVLTREKTLAAAARRLAVDQTTVARRLRALEDSLGAVLFERDAGQWRLTAFGQRALERAERIEEDVASILRSAEAEAQHVSGLVRLTSVPSLNSEYLIHHLPDLYARYPDIEIDLVDSDANLNIARREADVAIRLSRPESGDFIIRKLAVMNLAVYELARPEVVPDRNGWVAYDEELMHVPEMRWLEAHRADGRVRLRNSSTRTLCGAVAGGIGRGILPAFVADMDPDLRRSAPGDIVLSRDLWLVIHREAREAPRIAVVADWLVERFTADARLFQGVGGEPAASEGRPDRGR